MAGTTAPGELKTAAVTELAVAQPGDDAELRALLRRSVIPGAIRLAFTREPDYFAADGLAGADDVTLVVRRGNRLVAMGRSCTNTLYRNGSPHRVGYLGELRIDRGAAAAPAMLRDGYEFLVRHAGPADGYFTSVGGENLRARRVLERGAAFGLPRYSRLCDLVTLVMPVGRGTSEGDPLAPDEQRLSSFLDGQSRDYQLALTWNESRFASLSRHGISNESFLAVYRNAEIIGAAAIWDQRAFRQTIVDSYDPSLRLALPIVNGLQALRKADLLPAPGSALAQGMLLGAFCNSAEAWRLLWPALARRARNMGLSWLTLSRDVRDPELAVLRELPGIREYFTTLYAVDWRDGPRWRDAWDTRLFRPEVSLL